MLIRIGILQCKKINFTLDGKFFFDEENCEVEGNFSVERLGNSIKLNNKTYKEIKFTNIHNSTFELKNVLIGIDFHWQQTQNQKFKGDLKFIIEEDYITAINTIDIEDYIYSVISSEMSALSFEELLKAHAVISRSWVINVINSHKDRIFQNNENNETIDQNNIFRWYNQSSHLNFDVCADDHCQRYQGIPQNEPVALKNAIEGTKGEVLMYDGKICDTRFSKCCGGYMEVFSSCWENNDFEYLKGQSDSNPHFIKNLENESEVQKFILSPPDVFCNTTDKNIIRQVFNKYDQNTENFFRWKVNYSQKELSEIIFSRSGIDFGDILELTPLKRGSSGRITKMKIVGSKRTITVGKELEIRKWLSKSHLYSSMFFVTRDEKFNFTITGAGWGHGVGLCQIGAAVMASKGYNYKEILLHYYPSATIQKYFER